MQNKNLHVFSFPRFCLHRMMMLLIFISFFSFLGCEKPDAVLSSGSGGSAGTGGGEIPDEGTGGNTPFTWQTDWWLDCDGDGFAAQRASSIVASNTPTPASNENGCTWTMRDPSRFRYSDCDDDEAAVFPRQDDLCDGVDTDCDGRVDEDAESWLNYPDCDGDDFVAAGWLENPVRVCEGPHPIYGKKNFYSMKMVAACGDIADPRGEDCDLSEPGCGPRWTTRAPRGANVDCDDTSWEISPNAGVRDICDGIDNNCNGLVDETELIRMKVDCDGDGYPSDREIGICDTEDGTRLLAGIELNFALLCSGTQGEPQLISSDDPAFGRHDCDCEENDPDVCEDKEPNINPGMIDYCGDDIDNDCNGYDPFIRMLEEWPDCDGDGYAERLIIPHETCDFIPGSEYHMSLIPPGKTLESLAQEKQERLNQYCPGNMGSARWTRLDPRIQRTNQRDCDDQDRTRFPQIPGENYRGFDRCDGVDSDCDGRVDEGYWGTINADLPKKDLLEAISEVKRTRGNLAMITARRTAYADCDGDGNAGISASETFACFNFDVRDYDDDLALGDPIFDGRRGLLQLFGAREGRMEEDILRVCPPLPDDHQFVPGRCDDDDRDGPELTNPHWVFGKPSKTSPYRDCNDRDYCVGPPLTATRFFTDCDGDGFAGREVEFYLCDNDIEVLRGTGPEDFNVTVVSQNGSSYELNYCFDYKNPPGARNRSQWFVDAHRRNVANPQLRPLVEGFDVPPHVRFGGGGDRDSWDENLRDCYDYDDRMHPVFSNDDYVRMYPSSDFTTDPHAYDAYPHDFDDPNKQEAARGIREQDENPNVHRGDKLAAYDVLASVSEEDFIPPNPLVVEPIGIGLTGLSGDFNCDGESEKISVCCTEADDSSTCVPNSNRSLSCHYPIVEIRANGLLRCCNRRQGDSPIERHCIWVNTAENECPDLVGPFRDYYQ